jgi:hypothetical protein
MKANPLPLLAWPIQRDDTKHGTDYYTAEQMREYGQASRQAALDYLEATIAADTPAPQPPQAATAQRLPITEAKSACAWTQDEDGAWDTACGQLFLFNEGGPEENQACFCHHCGGKIEVTP